jgi:hypothetical protein
MIKYLLILVLPIIGYSQKQTNYNGKELLAAIPYKDGQIVYESVIYLDSVNDQNQVFNSAKAALIQNTNYKYSKIDEDRIAGSLVTEIRYNVTNQASIRLNIFAQSLLRIDVKENRFRIRITDHVGLFQLLGEQIQTSLLNFYQGEIAQIESRKKWKYQNSYAIMWDARIKLIMDSFSVLISRGITDDF